MINLTKGTVFVTGANGFLGSHVVDILKEKNINVEPIYHGDCDLTEPSSIFCFFSEYSQSYSCKEPFYVIHCAGFNGGIEFNRKYPITILEKNTLMALHLLSKSRQAGVKKIVSVLSSCAYQDSAELLREEEFGNGPCNPSIEYHGYAKRILFLASKAYSQNTNLKAVTACLTNLYGPRDTFDLERTKVVGALVKKFCDAKNNKLRKVSCWGTGNPLREFMFVKDAAKLLVKSLEVYEDETMPLNIGTGYDISIRELAETIARLVNFKGKIAWETTKNDGQMKKLLSNERTKKILGEMEFTPLEEGLAQTIDYYQKKVTK